jgi:uncharacterized protein
MVRTGSLLILIFIAFLATAKKVPPAPTEYRWVQDYGNVLDADQELFLMNKLKKYFDSTSTEIVIVTENSLEGDDVFDYSYRLAQEWGVGQKGKDNGVLIYADIYAKRVVENQLKPNFRKGKYGKGFDEATTVIIQHLSGEFVNGAPAGESEGIPIWVIILVVVLLVLMFTSGGNNGQTYTRGESSVRRRSHLPPFWIGGGGGGGFSGGGFGGGLGGGSFGGGGAGGSW